MLSTALIVFRESLESALFIGIVAAATRHVAGRGRWLSAGVLAGLAGAVLMALGAERLSGWADGVGQDLVNVGILGLALAMLAWHCIWGSRHGREAAREARQLGGAVGAGARRPWALAVAIGLAVLREGAETVLFVAGMAGGEAGSWSAALAPVLVGLAAGGGVGLLVYLGLSRVPPHRMLQVANGLILLLAAAIASQLARALAQAGLVDLWSQPVWDSSRWLAVDSPLGTLLHAMAGYDPQPSGLQLAFYALALAGIYLAARRAQSRPPGVPARA
jgi:high-affinity iron transporter